jgi:hypothetical protein
MTNQNSKPKKDGSTSKVDVDGNVKDSVVISGSGNVVNIGDKNGSPKNKPPKNKIDLLQTVAIILIAILVIAFGLNSSGILVGAAGTPTETFTLTPLATATNTLKPNEPTFTPVTPTDTPALTPSPIPPVPLGEDWTQGCISKLWLTYPSTVQTEDRNDGCWKEPIHAFSAENGDLDFLFERPSGDEEIFGLFAALPIDSGSLTLTIRLRDLSNADLLIGIFAQPEVKSPGLLMMMLNGGVDSNVFIQKNPMTYETIIGSQKIFQGNGYSITFRFDNLSVRSIVNPSVFFVDPFSLPASQKYLFLGYKGLRGYYRIEGTFLNFDLKE